MKKFYVLAMGIMALSCGFVSCNDDDDPSNPTDNYYQMVEVQKNTVKVLWNPEDYNFEDGNRYWTKYFADKSEEPFSAGACSSWRNGSFHGRNLDWYQADYGCMIIQMPKGGNVKHASVSLLNSSSTVTQAFLNNGVISAEHRAFLPCTVVDGINDAGIAININIVPYDGKNSFIQEEGNLSSQCVVRYVLDNAGSVKEAIQLLEGRKIRQSIAKMAGDETHYMISGKDTTAVVEFKNKEMKVTYFYQKGEEGCFSTKGNPAIMTNLYDCDLEEYGLSTPEFFEHSPYAMGIERWNTIKDQYPTAKKDVEANFKIAQSVWYFKNFMADKTLWYSENAIPSSWGKEDGKWYFAIGEVKTYVADCPAAQVGFWNAFMPAYWAEYEKEYGNEPDPHLKGNYFWETSHSVVYDLNNKKGYLVPFENFYAKSKPSLEVITLELP